MYWLQLHNRNKIVLAYCWPGYKRGPQGTGFGYTACYRSKTTWKIANSQSSSVQIKYLRKWMSKLFICCCYYYCSAIISIFYTFFLIIIITILFCPLLFYTLLVPARWRRMSHAHVLDKNNISICKNSRICNCFEKFHTSLTSSIELSLWVINNYLIKSLI